MGKERDVEDVITKLKKESDEIIHILVVSTELHVQSSVKSSSIDDGFSAAKFYVAVKMIEDAINDKGIDFETIKIESAGSSVIIKEAGTALVVVEVTEIVPGRPIGFLTESGPKGTIGHINDAVEKIKAVLLKQ